MKNSPAILLLLLFSLVSCTNGVTTEKYNAVVEENKQLYERLNYYIKKYGEIPSMDKSNNEYGIWKIGQYVDEFGDKTNSKYVYTQLYGTFNNSATTNSELRVVIIFDKYDYARINLYEYGGNHPIKNEGFLDFKAQNPKKEILTFRTYNDDSGDNTVRSQDGEIKALKELLLKGGEIKFIGVSNKYGSRSEYKFSIKNADYLNDALESII